MDRLEPYRAALDRLAAEDRLRVLLPRNGQDFASNDYLGLAASDELADAVRAALDRGVPVGAGGSRLLRGNHPEHEALEAEAAAFFSTEDALYFSSGFAANSTIFATLPDRRDLIVHDQLIHASVHDGMRLSLAEKAAARHNDPQAFDDAITAWRARGGKGRPWIAVEALYSMDGDFAPLEELFAVACRHDAWLVVDEAHSAGIYDHPLASDPRLVRLATCGKALGAEGALVLGPTPLMQTLVNKGRGFIFSTAPSPLMAATVRASLALLAQSPARRQALMTLVEHAGHVFGPRGATLGGSQIIPLILGDDGSTMRKARALQQAGFDVRGIRPPTVPRGQSRLRISITLNVTTDVITALGDALA